MARDICPLAMQADRSVLSPSGRERALIDYAFIRHNLLTIDAALDFPAQQLVAHNGTVMVELEDVTGQFEVVKRARNRRLLARMFLSRRNEANWSKPASIYKVRPATGDNPLAFPAYICPYRDNETHSLTVRTDARVMFTGEMDGCTFGIGMPNTSGHVRVAHSNAQNLAQGTHWNPNFAPQRQAQTQNVTAQNAGDFRVEPDRYRVNAPDGTEFKAVVIGLSDGRNWRFYYQHQQVDGNALRNLMKLICLN